MTECIKGSGGRRREGEGKGREEREGKEGKERRGIKRVRDRKGIGLCTVGLIDFSITESSTRYDIILVRQLSLYMSDQ